MSTGRSTEFDTHIVEGTREYLDTYQDDSLIPTTAGLALHLKVSRNSINAWEKDTTHPEGLVDDDTYSQFATLMEELRCKQEQKLVNGGLSGDYTSPITKLLLTKHGYTDKVETNNTTYIDMSVYSDEQLEKMAE